MALQNIGAGNKDDAFYRYKMPRMITKIEGRGNGIKTNIVNMVDIAKALSRPASYTTKYFGCELGAQSKFEEKTGTSHVNGAHETSKLAGLLENFIKKYVQCYGCGNPETEIIITKSQMITLKCAACGFLSDVDMRDKLNTFILKNPPEQKKGSSKDKKAMRRAEKERLKEGEAADEELKKLKKDTTKKKGLVKTSPQGSQGDETEASASAVVEDDDDNDDGGDDVEWQTDTSAEAARQRIQEQLSAVTAGMVMLSTNEEKPKSETYGGKLVSSIKEYLKKGSTATQFKSFVKSLSDKPKDIMDALFESLFGGVGKGSLSKEVVKKKNYLAAVCGSVGEGEGEGEEGSQQMLLLEAIETFCGKTNRDAVKEVALVLKALYDIDVLEEEYVVEWYEKGMAGSNKGAQIWKNVKPFVEWLQSAESESEEE